MKTHDINPISLASSIDAAIGKAFIEAEGQSSIDHLRSIFNRVAGLGYRIRIIGELQTVEYIKFNRYTREKPNPFDDSSTVGIEVLTARIATAIEDLRELKSQAIDAMDFERAANYRDIQKILLGVNAQTPMNEVLTALSLSDGVVYPLILKTHVRFVEDEVEIFILTQNKNFFERMGSLVPIPKKGWIEWLRGFFKMKRE